MQGLKSVSFLWIITGLLLLGIWIVDKVSGFGFFDELWQVAGMYLLLGLITGFIARRSSAK